MVISGEQVTGAFDTLEETLEQAAPRHGLNSVLIRRPSEAQIEFSAPPATKQQLVAADARQHDHDNQLAQTLATLAADKRTLRTPAQIVRDHPSQIPLPSPIVL